MCVTPQILAGKDGRMQCTPSRLATQTTRAILCLGPWSLLHLTRDTDVMAISQMQDVEEGLLEEDQLEEGWDRIPK